VTRRPMPNVDRSGGGGVRVSCRCGDVFRLMLHHDAKTAPSVEIGPNGSPRALVPNAWPLPVGPLSAGGSCDATTSACTDCYAASVERYNNYQRGTVANLEALRHLYACGGRRAVTSALVAVVRQSERLQLAEGVAPVFRWHSGGDVFARWYGVAIRETIEQTPTVDHWLYTRDPVKVRYMLPVPSNARVMLSADSENVARMARAGARYGLPLAMLADDNAHAVALWAKAQATAPTPSPVTCPASGKWTTDGLPVSAHVVGRDGRRSTARPSSLGVGACYACGVCLPGAPVRGVTFLLHGGKARPDSAGRLGAAVAVRVRRGLAVAQ